MQYKEEWIGLGIPLSQSLPVGGSFLQNIKSCGQKGLHVQQI